MQVAFSEVRSGAIDHSHHGLPWSELWFFDTFVIRCGTGGCQLQAHSVFKRSACTVGFPTVWCIEVEACAVGFSTV